MWLIMRNPTVSMPSSRAAAMWCAEISASVQWVATRTTLAPARLAAASSRTVPMPGSTSVATRAFLTTPATASIHSRSVWAANP